MLDEWLPMLRELAQNPVLFAAIISIVRNILGYFTASTAARKFVNYEPAQLLETLLLWETLLIILIGFANLPASYAVGIGLILDFVRSFRKAITEAFSKAIATVASG